MRFHEAFDETLKECGITAKWLAQQAGLTPNTISEFRRGKKSLGVENFEKLLYSLPKEVQEHFQKKIFVSSIPEDGDIWAKIDSMSTKELSQLIIAIAQRIPEVDKLQKV
jgi:transcriptional regulator with XRE-family HTH domain